MRSTLPLNPPMSTSFPVMSKAFWLYRDEDAIVRVPPRTHSRAAPGARRNAPTCCRPTRAEQELRHSIHAYQQVVGAHSRRACCDVYRLTPPQPPRAPVRPYSHTLPCPSSPCPARSGEKRGDERPPRHAPPTPNPLYVDTKPSLLIRTTWGERRVSPMKSRFKSLRFRFSNRYRKKM